MRLVTLVCLSFFLLSVGCLLVSASKEAFNFSMMLTFLWGFLLGGVLVLNPKQQ